MPQLQGELSYSIRQLFIGLLYDLITLLCNTANCSFGRVACQIRDCAIEIASVQKHHKIDRAAAPSTLSTMEDLLSEIDRKPVLSAALRARPATIDTASQLDPSPRKLILEANGARAFDLSGGDHGAPKGTESSGPSPGPHEPARRS